MGKSKKPKGVKGAKGAKGVKMARMAGRANRRRKESRRSLAVSRMQKLATSLVLKVVRRGRLAVHASIRDQTRLQSQGRNASTPRENPRNLKMEKRKPMARVVMVKKIPRSRNHRDLLDRQHQPTMKLSLRKNSWLSHLATMSNSSTRHSQSQRTSKCRYHKFTGPFNGSIHTSS